MGVAGATEIRLSPGDSLDLCRSKCQETQNITFRWVKKRERRLLLYCTVHSEWGEHCCQRRPWATTTLLPVSTSKCLEDFQERVVSGKGFSREALQYYHATCTACSAVWFEGANLPNAQTCKLSKRVTTTRLEIAVQQLYSSNVRSR